MGKKKKRGNSWFTLLKRAFRISYNDDEKESNKNRGENGKRREKLRWIFQKKKMTKSSPGNNLDRYAEKKQGISTVKSETAADTAPTKPLSYVEEEYAAIIIQTSFRGYLARRALRALVGIVKLQAIVRGQIVRRKAEKMMKYVRALSNQSSKLLQEGRRNSMSVESNTVWESKYLPRTRERKSTSRDRSLVMDDWDDRLHKLKEIKEMLQNRKEAALKRERTMAYAFSNKISRIDRTRSVGSESELEGTKWLDRWMATKQCNSTRFSTDKKDITKPFEIDSSSPYKARHHSLYSHLDRKDGRAMESPRTPPLCNNIRHLSLRSSTTSKCLNDERTYSTTTANTPHLGVYCLPRGACRVNSQDTTGSTTPPTPNYMAATESTKAKMRSQSTPRTRPSTPERERSGSARKRLSYLVVEPEGNIVIGRSSVSQNLRSPSLKSGESTCGLDQQSNMHSFYTCSTTDLRRWLN